MNIGIDNDHRKAVVHQLNHVLADSYTLYLKTHNFHWNVTGPRFNDLHAMFMAQYTEMWTAVDVIAERIRALGAFAPGSYRAFAELSAVKEASPEHPDAAQMVDQLLTGHETVIRTLRSSFEAAEAANDQVTLDLLTQRLEVHEKTAWMLRSLQG
jgi:starvation-inducible DNA-binding protein